MKAWKKNLDSFVRGVKKSSLVNHPIPRGLGGAGQWQKSRGLTLVSQLNFKENSEHTGLRPRF